MSGGSHDRRKSRRLLESAVERIVSEKYIAPIAGPEKHSGKPVAMWVSAAAIVVSIFYWLIPEKTAPRVVLSLLIMFVLLAYITWNFWWIEKKLWRRGLALLVLTVGLSTLGYFTWQSRARVIEQLNALAGKNEWNTLAKRLNSLDHSQELRDVDFYYRGLLYSNARPAPDPETYLSQVPQESDLFLVAQRLRLHNYSLAPSERLAKAIFDSLDHATILNPIYYRFKLELSPNLSYSEIAALYEEFEMRHNNLFDFTNMNLT